MQHLRNALGEAGIAPGERFGVHRGERAPLAGMRLQRAAARGAAAEHRGVARPGGERRRGKREKGVLFTGGAVQLCADIEMNTIDLVIFLRDPLTKKPKEPEINDIVRLCDMHNIPLATNLASAELLVKAMNRGDMEWRDVFR